MRCFSRYSLVELLLCDDVVPWGYWLPVLMVVAVVELVEGCCRQLAWSVGWIRRSEERSQMVEFGREKGEKSKSRVFDEQKGKRGRKSKRANS